MAGRAAHEAGRREAAADDGRRAVAIVRERAKEWDLDLGRIGMIGFSAGAILVTDSEDAPPLFTVIAQDDFVAAGPETFG